jgi:colicin import membrane protein
MENERNASLAQMSTIQASDLRFCSRLDKPAMLRLSQSLRGSFAARRALGRVIVILALAMTQSVAVTSESNAKQKPLHVMNIKLYAYNQMSWKQFECYNWLIHHESRWSYTARNGSHYGLGQMRSAWYGTLNPMKQIDVHLKYIAHRYDGKPCKALAHWERKGWH